MILAALIFALSGAAWAGTDAAPVEVPVTLPLSGPALVAPARLDPGLALPGGLSLPDLALPSPALPTASVGAATALDSDGPASVQAVLASVPAQRSEDAASPLPAQTMERFRGLAPQARAAVLSGLEALARSGGAACAYRDAFQQLAVQDELVHIEPRLRAAALDPRRRDDVAGKTYFKDVRWYHRFDRSVDPDGTGVPNGRTFPDNRIGMFVHSDWRKSPDYVGQLRVLFAHEYTHRLQNEGEYGTRWGVEIPAVATELLRGLELFGLDGLRQGAVSFIGQGVLGGFESGRGWARQDGAPKTSVDGFYHKGFLAGAAYELALRTGRWEDAWAFHRAVSTGAAPADAARRILDNR